MKVNDLATNPFSKHLIELVDVIFSSNKKHSINNNRDSLTDKEKYIIDVFTFHSKIFEILESLDYVIIFLKKYNTDEDCYKENGIDIIKYIKYHLETFAYKISTIHDLLFKLINEIYQLNLEEEECNWKHIKKKKKNIMNQDILICLDCFHFTFKNLITVRNIIAHNGENPIPDFDELKPYLFLYYHAKNKKGKKYAVTKHDYLITCQQIIKQKEIYENSLWTHIERACSLINLLFSNLEKDFKTKLNSFQS